MKFYNNNKLTLENKALINRKTAQVKITLSTLEHISLLLLTPILISNGTCNIEQALLSEHFKYGLMIN